MKVDASADPDRRVWESMLSYLRRAHPVICRQWFEELEPLSIAGGAFSLRAQSTLHRDYLRKQCNDPFTDAAQNVTGRLLSVRFLGPEDEVPPPPATRSVIEIKAPAAEEPASHNGSSNHNHTTDAPSREIIARRSDDSIVINPDYCFDNFVVGPSNRLAHAAAIAVASNPGRTYNPFFVHGGVGLGKTHLLQAICIQIKQANPNAVICYFSCEAFVTQFIEAVRSGEMSDFRHRYRDADFLVIDDIHFLAKMDRTQEEFFHTFNALYQNNRQIVLSSDAAPNEIPQLEDRLVSRFSWGLVAKIEPPDFETRVAILKTKARLRGMNLPDDAASFVASRVESNIRELEGAIIKLQIQSMVDHKPVDLALARTALGEVLPKVTAEPNIQAIIGAVTDFYRVRLVDLQSERRHRSVAQPRQVCMYLIRQLTRHSLEEIGGYFGNRDHTTVMHALRTVEERRVQDPEFDLVVRSLQERVGTGDLA